MHKLDKVKLAYHRIVARRLKTNPEVLDKAKTLINKWKKESNHPIFVDEWDKVLSMPIDEIRREITKLTTEMTFLRRSSPFPFSFNISDDAKQRLRKMFY